MPVFRKADWMFEGISFTSDIVKLIPCDYLTNMPAHKTGALRIMILFKGPKHGNIKWM
jgi:hypothetical protein